MPMMLTLLMLGCMTRVHVISTDSTAQVKLVRGGPMPQEGQPIQGLTMSMGEGQASARVPYVIGRRWWAVSDAQDGTRTTVQLQTQAKPAPIVSCAAGALLVWPALVGCLYVAGPTSRPVTIQAQP